MEDMLLLDAIERYLSGIMLPDEKAYFEHLRKTTPGIDQMVVEHKLFLHQMEMYSERDNLQHALNKAHESLVSKGDIYDGGETSVKGKVIQLWYKYRKVTGIAASIAGVTALLISGLVSYFSPSPTKSEIEQLNRKVNNLAIALNTEIKGAHRVVAIPAAFNSAGSGFLIDGKGFIITNAHVLNGSNAVIVQNKKGDEFEAKILSIDKDNDLAILKIDDDDFRPINQLPYSIKKSNVNLGEELYTLGYPRDSITYNMGYLSAESGFNGDTTSCQISLSANPGNSGGPVFNKNGEIVGVLSAKQVQAEGVVFAIKSKNIFQLVDSLKKSDSNFVKMKMPVTSGLKGEDRVTQIKNVEDFVFLIKAYNKK